MSNRRNTRKSVFSTNKMYDHALHLCFDTTSYISVICTDYHSKESQQFERWNKNLCILPSDFPSPLLHLHLLRFRPFKIDWWTLSRISISGFLCLLIDRHIRKNGWMRTGELLSNIITLLYAFIRKQLSNLYKKYSETLLFRLKIILYFTDTTLHEKDNYLLMTIYSHMSYAIHHSGREK